MMPPDTRAATPSEPDFSSSETPQDEIWKNPLFDLGTRLLMADGAVAFARQVASSRKERIEELEAILASIEESVQAAKQLPGYPAWIPCEACDEFFCTIHLEHACDCPCPPIEDWSVDPYVTGGRPLPEDARGGGDLHDLPRPELPPQGGDLSKDE